MAVTKSAPLTNWRSAMPYQLNAQPMNTISKPRTTILRAVAQLKSKLDLLWLIYIATPIQKTKNGNTKSVGVQPFHAAWRSGA